MNRTDRVRPYGMLLLICLGLYLPGFFSVPAVDRDEARFAQASRQMLEDRDFVTIRFQDTPRHKKPVGIYWLQAAAVAAFGQLHTDRIWAYRLPSLVGAVIAVWLTFAFGCRLFDRRIAFYGALLTAASILLMVEARLAKTDAMQLATVLIAQGCLALTYVYSREGKPVAVWIGIGFWIAQGAGILIKGPVLPLVSLATIVALVIADRRAGWLKSLQPLPGIVILAAMVSPWMIAITKATSGTFFSEAVGGDLLPKLISGQESHGAPPGYYLLLMFATFWPGSVLVVPAVRQAWRDRTDAVLRFCLAWILPTWLVFELIPTKLPHYVLPVYPALALLAARSMLTRSSETGEAFRTWAGRIGMGIWLLITLALGTAATAVPFLLEQRWLPAAALPLAAAILLVVYAGRNLPRGRIRETVAASVIGGLLIMGPTFQVVFPNLGTLWLSREAAAAVSRVAAPASGMPRVVAAVGYHEPSLVFHCGTAIHLAGIGEGASLLEQNPEAVVIVADAVDAEFLRHAPAGLQRLDSIRGFNYTKGDWVTLTLYGRDLPYTGGDD